MTASFQPRDLTINIRATSKGQHVLNGGPKGATFPGWFLQVQQNEGYDVVRPAVQLTVDEVVLIAGEIDKIAEHTDKPTWRIVNAVKACDRAMQDDLRRQLDAAEAMAARIPALRKSLGLDT